MNKWQKEGEFAKLKDEEKVLKDLKRQYKQAGKEVAKKIRISDGKIKVMLENLDDLDDKQKSILQSQIYQRNFQESLKKQIDGVLDSLNTNQFKSVDEYLKKCYETGFVATMYDIAGQGIPLVLPIDQKAVLRAATLDPKLSRKLYGTYTRHMATHIRNEISRGIATADTFGNIARNISARTNQGFNKAMRIVRTEGHKIQIEAAVDAQHGARNAGADVVKQWDSTLDGKTRPTHRQLDGQIRELDDPFEVAGTKVMHPSAFGMASEDINCRCALLQRATWALDDDELETLKKRAEYFGLDKTKDFDDYKKKYLKVSKPLENAGKSSTIKLKDIPIHKSIGAKSKNYDVLDLDTGKYFRFTEGTRLQDVEVFAGKGTKKQLRIAEKYANRHGGKPEDWQHVKAFGYIDTPEGSIRIETHWMQCEGVGKFDFFIKEWLE